MIEKITAQSMKQLASKENDEIVDTLNVIKSEAKGGKTEVYLRDRTLQQTTTKELESRGFKLEIGGRYNERNVIIKWD